MAVNRVQALRSSVAGNTPAPGARLPGEIWVNFPDLQFGTINPSNNAQKLLAVRFFSTTASYVAGDVVLQGTALYQANTTVAAGAFVPAQWNKIATSADIAGFLPLAGGTLTGPLLLNADPSAALGASTKQYVDGKVGIPSGSAMLFWQATAPVGWTKVTTHNDKTLRVVSGATGGGAGGTNGFSTVFAQTVVGNHTLSLGELPPIPSGGTNHISLYAAENTNLYFPTAAAGWSGVLAPNTGSYNVTYYGNTTLTYNNYCAANVSVAVTSSGTNSSPHNHPITMDVQYLDVIIATKN